MKAFNEREVPTALKVTCAVARVGKADPSLRDSIPSRRNQPRNVTKMVQISDHETSKSKSSKFMNIENGLCTHAQLYAEI